MATIPTIGVKLSVLQTNLGGSNPTSLSEYYTNGSYTYSLPNVGYGTIPTSGPISMGLFRGQGVYVLRNITSSGYNLRSWAVSSGWNGTSAIIIKIDASCSFKGLIIDSSWPGGLTVLNYGTIIGQGGSGGSSGGAGGSGSSALLISGTSVIYFKNYGTIAGGGGGGGSSTIAPQNTIATYGYLYPGGGGGAGGGAGGSGIRSKGGTYSGGSGGGIGSSGSAGSYATPMSNFLTVASGTQGYGGGAGGGGGGTFYFSTLDTYYASGGGGGGGVIGGSGGTGGTSYYYTSGSSTPLGGDGGSGSSSGGSGKTAGSGSAGQLRAFAGAGGGGGWGAYGGYGAYGWVPGGAAGAPGYAISKGGNTNFSYSNFGTMYGSVL